jgi:ubiquinone/menaquinone biosynthesis C-methylase UbiE
MRVVKTVRGLAGRCRRNGQAGLFSVADAQALPSQDGSFDEVASALVINFVQDREQALRETRRVARAGGFVIGYVWELEAELSPSWPLRRRTISLKVVSASSSAEPRICRRADTRTTPCGRG